jgi:PhnB protein
MSTKDNRIVQPYLFFNGSCEQAIEFYRKALGAEVEMMMRFKESPEPPPPGAVPPGSENKIMHASFRIGQTTVLASDGDSSDKANFQGFSLSLAVPSEAEADRAFNALAEGGSGKAATHKDVLFATLWHGGRPVRGGLDDHARVARPEMSPGIQDKIKRHG